MNKEETLKNLLERKEKLNNKLITLKKKFEEDRDNEEAWPGTLQPSCKILPKNFN